MTMFMTITSTTFVTAKFATIRPVTETGETFIEWVVEYSTYVEADVFETSKQELLTHFKDIAAAAAANVRTSDAGSGNVFDIRGARELVTTQERARELFKP
jgi:hypothetical protein